MAISDPGQPFQPFNPYPDMGGFGNMIMPIVGNYMSQEHGISPMGMGGGNMYNNMMQMRLTEDQQQAIRSGGEADRGMMMNTIRGAANIAGQKWDDESEAAASGLVNQGINLAAMGSPQMLDQLSGGRSATAMAAGMFEGGRYAADPVYGDVGMSANSVGAMTSDIYAQFYGDRVDENGEAIQGSGAREWRGNTDGVTSGQMGQLYSRLSREGMMGSIAPMTNDELDNFEDATEGEQSNMQASRREGAARKATETLKGWTGSLAALKEVFGENSSFDDLMKGMEEMTGGSYSQMTGKQVESSMRQMVESGKLAGVGTGEVVQRTHDMASELNRGGINSIFAPQLVTNGLNFASGYQQAGAGATPSWGLYGADQQRNEHTKNVVGASQSKVANRMGAVARLSDRLGPDAFTGEAKDLMDSIKDGQIPEQYADMSRGEFIKMLTDNSDLSSQEVQYALQAKNSNQEAVHKYKLGESVQRLQKVEMRDDFMAPALGTSARVSVSAEIGTSEGSDQLGTDLGGVMADSISGMDAATLSDPTSRNAQIASDVLTKLEEWAAKDPEGAAAKYLKKLQGMSPKKMQQKLVLLAEQGYSSMEGRLQQQGVLAPGESYVNFGVRNTDAVQEGTDVASQTAENHATNASNAAGMAGGGMIQRGAEYIQQGGTGGLPGLAANLIGQPNRHMVAGVLGTQLDNYDDQLAELNAAENPDKERIARIEGFRDDALQMAENYGLTNEEGEFDPAAAREDASEGNFDPNISFSGATVVLNGAEILTQAEGGIVRTGQNEREAG